MTAEYAHYWRDAALDALELLHAHYVTHRFAPHTHEGYAIGVIEAGAEQFKYRGRLWTAPAGTVVVIHPGEVHDGAPVAPGGFRYRMFYPAADVLSAAAAATYDRAHGLPFFPEAVINDPDLAAQFTATHRAIEAGATPLARESMIAATMAALVERHAAHATVRTVTNTTAAAPLRRVKDLIDDAVQQEHRLDTLAALAGMDRYELLRGFRRAYGLPPHAYQTQLRIRHAKLRLAQGQAPAQVAVDLGFVDQAHLSRHFKRIVGVPPGRYAQFSTRR
jgi:AraC-like DNA-binding protein